MVALVVAAAERRERRSSSSSPSIYASTTSTSSTMPPGLPPPPSTLHWPSERSLVSLESLPTPAGSPEASAAVAGPIPRTSTPIPLFVGARERCRDSSRGRRSLDRPHRRGRCDDGDPGVIARLEAKRRTMESSTSSSASLTMTLASWGRWSMVQALEQPQGPQLLAPGRKERRWQAASSYLPSASTASSSWNPRSAGSLRRHATLGWRRRTSSPLPWGGRRRMRCCAQLPRDPLGRR